MGLKKRGRRKNLSKEDQELERRLANEFGKDPDNPDDEDDIQEIPNLMDDSLSQLSASGQPKKGRGRPPVNKIPNEVRI